jgi:hypothetical protein
MKKQDKTYLTIGVFVIFIISLGWASWQMKEGFKEDKGKGKRAERREAKRAAAAAPAAYKQFPPKQNLPDYNY